MSRQFLQNPALRQATTLLFGSGKNPISAMHSLRSASPFSPNGAVRNGTSTAWRVGRDTEDMAQWKESVQDMALKNIETMPQSKFRSIEAIPYPVKSLFTENTSEAILRGGFPSLFKQSEIEKNAALLNRELENLSRNGDQNAIAMMHFIKDAARGNVTQSYIADGIPPLTITGVNPSTL